MTRRATSPKCDIAKYLLEFTPIAHGGTPTGPCPCCLDRVFYRMTVDGPWLCRTCHLPGAASWRMATCSHEPQCEPPTHARSAICRWLVAP